MTTIASAALATAELLSEWSFPDGVTYLNPGSFGPSPRCVRQARHEWSERLEAQPMDFFLRQMETALDEAADTLGKFIGASGNDLLFCDNATVAMNIVAESVSAPLQPGDEILFTDQEYGAVMRIWRRAVERVGARVVIQSMPRPVTSADEQVAAVMNGVTERTKLIVVSHITSPTAVIFPQSVTTRLQISRSLDKPLRNGQYLTDTSLLFSDQRFQIASFPRRRRQTGYRILRISARLRQSGID